MKMRKNDIMKIGQKVTAQTNNSFHKIGDKGVVVNIEKRNEKDEIPFLVEWNIGKKEWCGLHELKKPKQNTLEIYPYRGGFRYRKIAANGKVLNHHYNTVAGAKKGAEAERKFWENFKIVKK